MKKVTIESPVSHLSDDEKNEMCLIIDNCLAAESDSELAEFLAYSTFETFIYGFGSSHFWACLKRDTANRIIFV